MELGSIDLNSLLINTDLFIACNIIIAFILGCEIKMVLSQLLWAHERCDVYCVFIRTGRQYYYGVCSNTSCKIQVTIAYSLLHLTR